MRRIQVLVVGGGPAGLASSIAARRQGLDVLVVDRRRPPIDKACGEGLMPDGVAALGRLGVSLLDAESMPLSGIRFLDGNRVASGRFPAGRGLGIRRTLLHEAMVRRALSAGVGIQWETRVREVEGNMARLDCAPIRADWIVAADGLASAVRRAAGLDGPRSRGRFGLRRHYALAPWSDEVEVHWAREWEAYVTPVGPNLICVALLASRPPISFEAAIRSFPALADRLSRARMIGKEVGGVTHFRPARRVVADRLALVGDAAGSVDAITGDGITLALCQAEALGDALGRGCLEEYEAEFSRLMRRPYRMTRLLLAMGGRPLVRRAVLRLLSGSPRLFSRLLAVHTGSVRRAGDTRPSVV